MVNANKKNSKVLRVGFDLDGVILYNPARIFRPLIALFKKIFIRKRLNKFWIPKKPWERSLWSLAHKSSIFIAPGFNDIKKLVKQNKIKAYLVTARFSFLKYDLQKWLNNRQFNKVFSQVYYNEDDEQPHLFKDKMIKKLNLDFFIEDNWDIVKYLSPKFEREKSNTKIFWIYNFFDKRIDYIYKFSGLKKAIQLLKKNIS